MQTWIRTTKWKPASPGGGSQGFSVECSETGTLGHAKPNQFHQEVIASLLADLVQVPVPETRLGKCEDKVLAVSKLWGGSSLDFPLLRTTSPTDASSKEMSESLRKACGLLAFHSWINTGDLKDEHVMVAPGDQPGIYLVASIDFASAFTWDATGGVPVLPPGPPILIADASRDASVLDSAISRIAGVAEANLAPLIQSVPEVLLPDSEKKRILNGLLVRKTLIRQVFQTAGWLR